ncbi:uncharacterized protein [Asterias amurensis]|uniref:uncharacterized protein n=1 Tax=Asterias amurensis TaxID=7602 RepID=UPI003AB17D00
MSVSTAHFLLFMMAFVSGTRVQHLSCKDPVTSTEIEYSPITHVCCDGHVHDASDGIGQNCCGKQLYDNLSSSCCGQEVLSVSGQRQCCDGDIPYDVTTQMCCGSKVYTMTDDLNTCCGGHAMDAAHDTCCSVTNSMGMSLIPRKGKGQCCGSDLTFDPVIQRCCQSGDGILSEVVSRNSRMACCGGQSYDTSHQLCCGETVSNMTSERMECCGTVTYDPHTDFCCADAVSPIGNGKCCDGQVYHPNRASCCLGILQDGIPEVSGVQGCCGQLSYLQTESICCQGRLHPKTEAMQCCGQDAFNSNTHLCCAGTLHSKSTPSDVCCGERPYDPITQTCCPNGRHGEEVFPVGCGQCCRDKEKGMLAYNPSKATCCVGRSNDVFYPDVPANTSSCCGRYLLQDTHLCDINANRPVKKTSLTDDRLCLSRNWRRTRSYNSQTQVCFHGMVRSKTRISNGCGPHILDPLTEMCCMGTIHSLQDKNGNQKMCCHRSTRSYIPRYQSCCSGRVDNIPALTAKCCRNRAYDTTTHTCDKNGIIRSVSEMALFPLLCGNQPYNPSDHKCCGLILIGPHQTCCRGVVYETGVNKFGAGECCDGVRGYNPERDICCGGVLHERVAKGTTCCGTTIIEQADLSVICCDGSLQLSFGGFRRDCNGGTAFNQLIETVCDGVVYPQPNGDCCGKSLYNSTGEICCSGVIYPKETPDLMCCGSTPYDSMASDQQCCEDTLHNNPTGSMSCCGNQQYNPQRHLCCSENDPARIPAFLLEASGSRTCRSLQSADDDSTIMYTLCDGRMHLPSATGACCGELYIDTETSVCCGGLVRMKLYGKNSVCCEGIVVDASVTLC